MYNASSHKLIDSFITTRQNNDLLVCYEKFSFISNVSNIYSYDISKYQFHLHK
jgi:hypothetical protein